MSDTPARPVCQSDAEGAIPVPLALLAGGLGTRLGAATANLPKSLVPVAGKPFIEHQLALLRRKGVCRVVICLGHLGEAIERHVGSGDEWNLQVQYSYDGPVLRGTAGALRQAAPLLGPVFLVMYGDSYLETDYSLPVKKLQASPALGVMVVCRNRNRWDRSNVALDNGWVAQYDKRRPTADMEYIDYGLGVLRAEALGGGEQSDLADVYARLVGARQLLAHEVAGRFYEIGSPAGRDQTEAHLAVLTQTPAAPGL